MKNYKKLIVVFIVMALVFIVINASSSGSSSASSFEEEITDPNVGYEEKKYVSETNNVFIILTKYFEKMVTFIVKIIFDVIGKIFELIFGI